MSPTAPQPGSAKAPWFKSPPLRWSAFGLVILLFVIVPFVIWEAPFSRFMQAMFDAVRAHPAKGAGLIIALLASDCVLPIPSSIVSAFAGAAFDWRIGAAVIWTGMTLGCLFGYALGASAGRGLARHLVGEGELAKARRLFADIGPAALIIARAVPVLAEASTLAAGAARMPLLPFLVSTSLANIGVALVYAGAGAAAAHAGSFLLIFLSLCLVPAIAWGVWRVLSARKSSPEAQAAR